MRPARLLAAVAVVAATLVPHAAAQPDEPALVRVDVRSMTAALLPDTEALAVRARAVNTTQEPVRRLRAGLRFGQAMLGRSSIAAGGAPARFGTRVGDHDVETGELAPGGTGDIDFEIPVDDLPFDRSKVNAVYPMRVEVRSGFEVVGAVDTYVVWWPQGTPRLRIAMVWPLAEPSHRAIGDDFYDDELAASVRDGRLDALLRLGSASRMPVTWAVDPELLDSLHRMSGTYTVRGEPGTNGAAARDFLERARASLRSAPVLPLPYADPDLTTTTAGPLAVDAGTAFRLGGEVLRRDLGVEGDATLAWPPGTTLDPAVEALLASQGVKGVVVPEAALPLSETLTYTPTAPTPLAPGALGSMTALVADAQLNRWVTGPTGQEGPRLAVQRFLADSAMVVMERPRDTRDVVVAPPRTWDPVRPFASQLTRQIVAAPWLVPVGLDSMLTNDASTAARTRAPSDGGLLAREQMTRVLAQRRNLQRVRGILTDPKRAPVELAELEDALLRAVSSRWGDDPSGGLRLANTVDALARRQLDKLRIVSGGIVTMTGRSGNIPVTFQNDLGQPVRVHVRLDSRHRLALEGNTQYESREGGEVTIRPGRSTIVITGRATTGGLFGINVDLLSSDGTPLDIRTTVRVRSTAYGLVALVVTGVAFGLLLVGSATRLIRRRRARPDPDPAPAPAPARV